MKHRKDVTFLLIGVFVLSQIIGLIVIDQYVDKEQTQITGNLTYKPIQRGGTEIERPEVNQNYSWIYIIIGVILGTILVLVLIRFKTPYLWRYWFFLAVFVCLSVALSAFINKIISLIIAALLSWWKIFKPNIVIHNATEVLLYGGLAAIFVPILNLYSAFVLLIAISIYDAYAVWKSRHMIKLADFQAKSRVFAGLLIPYRTDKKISFREKMPKGLQAKRKTKYKSAVLGGGDIAFSLLFAGVVMKYYDFYETLIVVAFSTFALAYLLKIGKKNKFYPAMPFISIGCFIGFGVLVLLKFLIGF